MQTEAKILATGTNGKGTASAVPKKLGDQLRLQPLSKTCLGWRSAFSAAIRQLTFILGFSPRGHWGLQWH
jgi:hypothetical protein